MTPVKRGLHEKCIIKMEINDESGGNDKNCTCYYFDDTIKIEDFDFDNILLDEKSYEKKFGL